MLKSEGLKDKALEVAKEASLLYPYNQELQSFLGDKDI